MDYNNFAYDSTQESSKQLWQDHDLIDYTNRKQNKKSIKLRVVFQCMKPYMDK